LFLSLGRFVGSGVASWIRVWVRVTLLLLSLSLESVQRIVDHELEQGVEVGLIDNGSGWLRNGEYWLRGEISAGGLYE
jgi:hypothetical protein